MERGLLQYPRQPAKAGEAVSLILRLELRGNSLFIKEIAVWTLNSFLNQVF